MIGKVIQRIPLNRQASWMQVSVSYALAEGETLRRCEGGVTLSLKFVIYYILEVLFLNRNHALQKLNSSGLLDSISDVINSGQAQYSVSQLGIPGLRHFIYKSRPHVQVTFPILEDPYEETEEKRRYYPQPCTHQSAHSSDRLITMYQVVYDAIHAKSGQSGPLKLQYVRTQKEIVMGWVSLPTSSP